MDNYNYCCSRDGHGLAYPQFSVVFIQTFSINRFLEFVLPSHAVLDDYDAVTCRISEEADDSCIWKGHADYLRMPIVYMKQNIERQIFVMKGNEDELVKKKLDRGGIIDRRYFTRPSVESFGRRSSEEDFVWTFPKKAVYRFSMRGFDFLMPLRPAEEEDFPPVDLTGHASVEMSLFFGNTVSMTYRFFFDGNAAAVLDASGEDRKEADAVTDHIIALLSTHLGAEYWSNGKSDGEGNDERLSSQSNINLESTLVIKNFWIDENGYETVPDGTRWEISGGGRTFDEVALRYKKYLYNNCTAYREGLSAEDKIAHEKYRVKHPLAVKDDQHYAMVDIWENVKHPDDDGDDIFDSDRTPRMSEAEIVDHIRDFHRPELIGLMTLYPGEWPYRDASAFDEVCGENIAIDTDDLVLVGSSLAIVIGTYGRRGDEVKRMKAEGVPDNAGTVMKQGVDWAGHLKERAKYHVSWPEYLLILQMVLAKKHVIGTAKDKMVDVTLTARDKSSEELIGENADLGMRLSRMLLQLDMVKYSKFASHIVMFDRTTRRLRLEKDMEELREIIDMVNESLHNLSDYKAMKSDFLLNTILLIISCASTFELFFQNSELPFLTYFDISSEGMAAWLVVIVATITLFAILLAVKSSVKKIWKLFIKK